MSTITLNPETINAFEELMINPKEHGLDMPSLKECFEETEEAIPRHILFNDYIKIIQRPLPKVIFYIVMDKLYQNSIAKAPNGDLGYKLKIKPII